MIFFFSKPKFSVIKVKKKLDRRKYYDGAVLLIFFNVKILGEIKWKCLRKYRGLDVLPIQT